ncbi:putative adenylate-forming enzyme [Duganella sp. SG902]|uniref:F390 synthetase-related protein n=1 Tax=Duganella sp. SG902 TaxID=2587016 RepID=UPI00159D7F58|nr:F390 synthetase-related protein [Duganella sp. SG902]NVM76528.1 putative adenylate-forming enzyme [Duganella sp. SG902]
MSNRLFEIGVVAWHFLRARGLRFRSRAALLAWQQKRIDLFLRQRLPQLPFYRAHVGAPLARLPIIDKSIMLANFDLLNNVGISLEEATATALAAEHTRDFRPHIGGVTVGLSSGTQGPRGVFMVARREQLRWAGIMLARVLDGALLRRLLFGRPLKVAFFMRANSNLYGTLASRRIAFRFYDLLGGLDQHLRSLQGQSPDILVAPARILGRIAALALEGKLQLAPRKVIAVAEVLEPDDRLRIEQAFGGPVHQLYQCTEGFLGYTCEHGVLHLNEEFVHIEPEWLDAARTRFVPIVTDFTRSTQHFIRYRLNDSLRVRAEACPCGSAALALDAVEGRCDDILWLPRADDGELAALYPDMIRHAISIATQALPDYRIAQHGDTLHIAVADNASFDGVAQAVRQAAQRQGLITPACHHVPFTDTQEHIKRRRIVCVTKPETVHA